MERHRGQGVREDTLIEADRVNRIRHQHGASVAAGEVQCCEGLAPALNPGIHFPECQADPALLSGTVFAEGFVIAPVRKVMRKQLGERLQ